MSIRKDVTVKITNNNATLDMPLQIYELDHGIELRFKLMDYKYKYTKDPQNILNSSDEDILEAYTTIINPRGYELQQINGEVKDDIVVFMIDSSYTDEIDEVGIYSLQIHIKCACSEFSIPPIQFEVLQRLKGIKVVTDGEDSIDDSALIDNYSNFISDETGKLLIEWKKGDIISSVKLNAMVEVINNAVDEEVQRQLNEAKREQQELERQNSVREALNSVDNRVDEAMNEYETRFNALTASQQQDMEVIDARDGEVSLKARLDRDLRKPLQVYEDVEGSYISCDSVEGYAQNVEILGNTIQNQNDLADIRSVGDKLENQELYEIPVLNCGKNLFNNKDYGIFKAANSTCTIVYNEITDTYEMTYSGAFSYAVLDLTKNLHVFEGKTLIASCKYSNSNSSAKFSIYLQGIDKEGKIHYFNSGSNSLAAIPKDTLTTLNLRVYANNSSDKLSGVFTFTQIQIEEGTVATPYEPYQGDKLTILSPVQLEKVGDVADRIICKDGVWGVEKNISTTVFDGSEHWRYHSTKDNTSFFQLSISSSIYRLPKNDNTTANILSNRFLNTIPNIGYNNDIEGIYLDTRTNLSVRVLNTKLNTQDLAGFKSWLSENSILLKYQLAQPTFIPLPHDQQINLRTFANKTNISFGCEIEPTLKASVPKSLGASVSSHSEQIDNLGKELDKVKKLEETVTSEVVSESYFTTVEETSNGYFEDVKLEGKTLVNLVDISDWLTEETTITATDKTITNSINIVSRISKTIKAGDKLTLIPKLSFSRVSGSGQCYIQLNYVDTDNTSKMLFSSIKFDNSSHLITIPENFKEFTQLFVGVYPNTSAKFKNNGVVLLEGDHTDKDISYFKGLKSVGDGVDEISVLSCNGNLFNVNDVVSDYSDYYKCDEYIKYENGEQRTYLKQDFEPNTQYSFTFKASNSKASSILFSCRYTDGTHESFGIINSESNKIHTSSFTSSEGKSIKEVCSFYSDSGIITLYLDGTCINKGTTPILYTPYKEDKKRILYYNDETQKWEKPILREWDSIEKHSDGKYYYHKRSGEVVLNGSENWADYGPSASNESSKCFYVSTPISRPLNGDYMCDRLSTGVYNADLNNVTDITKVTNSLYFNTDHKYSNYAYIRVELSKLSSQDVAGFKTWLQANQTTVVCQLETEKVYECTDLDLITYQNETNLMVKGGAIVPKTTLKVHQNIANIATILQEKVNRLENNVGHVNGEIDNINTDLTSLTESIEGSSVSVVSKDGYLKDVEILGNTIQNQNDLADIRSVGDKVEGQELYEIPVLCTGKNLYNESKMVLGMIGQSTGEIQYEEKTYLSYEYYIPVKPNTTYVINKPNIINMMFYYDKDKKYISSKTINISQTSFITPSNCKFIRFRIASTVLPKEFQLEEGTVATPYEPYQEDKLTILSPTPLEKVGDVADRIICKDGVWGVEKNIYTKIFNGSERISINMALGNVSRCTFDLSYLPNVLLNKSSISNKLKFILDFRLDEPHYYYDSGGACLFIPTNELDGITPAEWCKKHNLIIKYQTTQPQFIPLPHDQQIKLRTFANKTNISFQCEIKPTLKASVPKSLSATVSTHTEQIDNLGKELDRVKKLEESAVSTVTTESDFTTVTETSNGYFEDVKIEGRTLVNLCGDCIEKNNNGINLTDNIVTFSGTSGAHWIRYDTSLLKPNTTYTLIMLGINVQSRIGCDLYPDNFTELGFVNSDRPINVYKFTTPNNLNTLVGIRYYVSNGVTASTKLYSPIILEGDHTQNPPEFFEGIKSVGQDVDEISVLSCNENLLNEFEFINIRNASIENGKVVLDSTSLGIVRAGIGHKVYLEQGCNYIYSVANINDLSLFNTTVIVTPLDDVNGVLTHLYPDKVYTHTIASGYYYLRTTTDNTKNGKLSFNISFNKCDTPKPYQPHKQDKKPLLYYNNETQTWEKPILRQWDSIEKHSDGKYYYHKRSGEVVFNGDEQYDWYYYSYGGFGTDIPNLKRNIIGSEITSYSISNSLTPVTYDELSSVGSGYYSVHYTVPRIVIKSDYATSDEFEDWLRSNPVIIVYQLETEEVYECTSIDLITYENETNFIVNTGAIAPLTTLKVMHNINNVVRELQQKVSNLENYIQHVMIDALNNALNE